MYNRVILMGRLTRDPELKQTPSGISVTTFSIAVNRPRSKTETDFIDIVAWRQTAEFVCRYFSRGKSILVEGYLQVRDFPDKTGKSRRMYEIVADQVSFTGEKKSIDVLPGSQSATAGSSNDFAELDDDGDLPF